MWPSVSTYTAPVVAFGIQAGCCIDSCYIRLRVLLCFLFGCSLCFVWLCFVALNFDFSFFHFLRYSYLFSFFCIHFASWPECFSFVTIDYVFCFAFCLVASLFHLALFCLSKLCFSFFSFFGVLVPFFVLSYPFCLMVGVFFFRWLFFFSFLSFYSLAFSFVFSLTVSPAICLVCWLLRTAYYSYSYVVFVVSRMLAWHRIV